MSAPQAITFDVYGTLTRWDEAVADTLRALLSTRRHTNVNLGLVAKAFEAESRLLQAEGAFRAYRDILRDSLVPALAVAGLKPTEADEVTLLQKLSCIPPFPDAPAVLRRLSQDQRLVPISNTDDNLIEGTLAQFGDVFATTVTAEQARAYKPNPGLFRYALNKLGLQTDEILHVAQGCFSDLAVCAALGIRVVWVNRQRATLQDGLQPHAVIDDLTTLSGVVSDLA